MPNNEWGDYQTPSELAERVLDALPKRRWERVLEPTCGTGTFLGAAGRFADAKRLGIEVNPEYAGQARRTGADVMEADLFSLSLRRVVPDGDGPLLVVGNPPWVTNADLTSFGSINLPTKSNLKGLSGMDAMTGASNFDIAEFMYIKLVLELVEQEPTIALLCKTQVTRNVFAFCRKHRIPVRRFAMFRIDAKRHFGASVDACLFLADIGGTASAQTCDVHLTLESAEPSHQIGFASAELVADVDEYESSSFADVGCEFEWRQGVKHDAAAVMELRRADEALVNGHDEVVEVEPEFVYPLLKSTAVARDRLTPDRFVVVTQTSLSSETGDLEARAPKLWTYLQAHAGQLDGRRSSIYRNRPRFAMFGIGPYTFAPWKVAISGLHKAPAFRLVGPVGGSPVVFDDTCYMLPFEERREAEAAYLALNLPATGRLLDALTFVDSKRPITKRLLRRISLAAVAAHASDRQISDVAESLSLDFEPDELRAALRPADPMQGVLL